MANVIRQARTGANQGMTLYLSDYRAMVRELRKVDKELPRALKRNYRKIGKPLQSAVKKAIPNTAPLGPRKNPKLGGMTPGMATNGRLGWGSGPTLSGEKRKPAKSVFIDTPARKKESPRKFSILRLRVTSAATSMADMAGRSGRAVNKYSVTRPYSIRLFGGPVIERTHRINNQGRRLIENLAGARGKVKSNASRYAWPSVEKNLDKAKIEAATVIDLYARVVNMKMKD